MSEFINKVNHYVGEKVNFLAKEVKVATGRAVQSEVVKVSAEVFKRIIPEKSPEKKGRLGKIVSVLVLNPLHTLGRFVSTPLFIARYFKLKKEAQANKEEQAKIVEKKINKNIELLYSFFEPKCSEAFTQTFAYAEVVNKLAKKIVSEKGFLEKFEDVYFTLCEMDNSEVEILLSDSDYFLGLIELIDKNKESYISLADAIKVKADYDVNHPVSTLPAI